MSSSAVPRAGSGSIPDRLSVGALGLALVLLVSAAWGTGLFYLIARLGMPSPVRLAWIDALHVYVGLVGAVFIVGKVLRVGFRYRVQGVPNVVPWQRWMSWSLLVLYGVIFVSGVLVLLPIHGRLYGDLIEVHLLTSVWAAVPTTWHVWHYRGRATPYLARFFRKTRGWRFWAGFALVMAPAAVVVTQQPPAVSQLPQVSGGATWSQSGLRGVPLSRIMLSPDGRALLAAGDKLYVSRDGVTWSSVSFARPSSFVPIPPGGTGKHTHSATSTVTTVIQSLAVGQAGYYAGTAEGLFLSPAAGGPFADLGFPGQNVAAIAVDPAKPQAVWTASTAGTMLSTDGGHTWTRLVNGLVDPGTVSSLVYMGSRLFASDAAGVFEWLPQQGSWARRSAQGSVVSLTAGSDGRVLYVASTTGEVRVLDGAGWQTLGAPGTAHLHSGQAHLALQGVLPFAGRLYAAGTTDGVSASADGGQTWTQLGGDVANRSPAQVVVFHGQLWAATTDGVYRYLLSADVPASVTWWAGLLAAALVIGSLALTVLGLERIRLRMGRPQRAPQPGYTYQPQRAPEPAAHTYQPQRQFVGVRPTYEYERPFFGVESYMTTVSPEPAPPREAPSTETLRWSQQPPTADDDRTRRVPNPSVEPIDRTRRVPPNPSVEPIDRTRRVPPNPSVEPIDRTRRLTDVDPMPPTRVLRPKGGYRRS